MLVDVRDVAAVCARELLRGGGDQWPLGAWLGSGSNGIALTSLAKLLTTPDVKAIWRACRHRVSIDNARPSAACPHCLLPANCEQILTLRRPTFDRQVVASYQSEDSGDVHGEGKSASKVVGPRRSGRSLGERARGSCMGRLRGFEPGVPVRQEGDHLSSHRVTDESNRDDHCFTERVACSFRARRHARPLSVGEWKAALGERPGAASRTLGGARPKA